MIDIEEFRRIAAELTDELPEEFFKELNGGVIVSERAVIPRYARGNDLFAMGQYQVYAGMRQIVLYKGSFDRVYPRADAEETRRILRGVLRHEFRHHLESLGGVRGPSSLEAEDALKKAAYLARHQSAADADGEGARGKKGCRGKTNAGEK